MVFFVLITVNQSHLRPICKSTKFNPKIQRTIYLINFQQLRLHVPDFIRTVVLHIINERYEKIVENYLKKAFTMLVNAFLMITMISICYFKTTFLPLMMQTPCFGTVMRCP